MKQAVRAGLGGRSERWLIEARHQRGTTVGDEYGIANTEKTPAGAKVAVTQQLPSWLNASDRVPS
jgi:hypothetical protein